MMGASFAPPRHIRGNMIFLRGSFDLCPGVFLTHVVTIHPNFGVWYTVLMGIQPNSVTVLMNFPVRPEMEKENINRPEMDDGWMMDGWMVKVDLHVFSHLLSRAGLPSTC